MEIKNLKKVAQRIKGAIKKRERIILLGDTDLDGVSSLIILKETIKNLGGQIAASYFPDRETEGYGLSRASLERLKSLKPALIITLDCGISNFKEAKLAKKLGFELIIIDHHEILDKLPEASIIVDPKQKDDKYPFKKLAATGVVFKLSEALLAEKMSGSLRKNFLELTAIATVADMMPREEDNKIFITEGLKYLENSWRPGLQTIFQNNYFKEFPTLAEKLSKFISVLNIRDVENNLPASFRLLDSNSEAEAEELIEKLIAKNERRKQRIEEIIQEAEDRISLKKEKIIFEGDTAWETILISSAASFLVKEHRKPTFLYKKMKKESLGTVRAPSEVNIVELMKRCQKFLLTFGGHPQAGGFRIKNENLEKFRKCLLKNYA